MPEAAELVAEPFITARPIGLDAQAGDMPRHCVDLAGEAGHPEGVDHVEAGDGDVDGNAGRQV